MVANEGAKPSAKQRMPVSINKSIGVVAWLAGAAATWLGLATFMPGAAWWLPVIVAVGVQLFLTLAQRAIWRGHPSFVGFGALIIDVALNAGGIFPYAMRVGETPTAQMVIAVAGGSRQIAPVTAMIVAIILGLLIAAAPEELWSRRD